MLPFSSSKCADSAVLVNMMMASPTISFYWLHRVKLACTFSRHVLSHFYDNDYCTNPNILLEMLRVAARPAFRRLESVTATTSLGCPPSAGQCTWRQPQPREPCKVMQGHSLADDILDDIKIRAARVLEARQYPPKLGVIAIGDNEASEKYIRVKAKTAKCVGIACNVVTLPKESTLEEALDAVGVLNNNDRVDGIIVQFPLPSQIKPFDLSKAVHPNKDVDGFHPLNQSYLLNPLEDLRGNAPDYATNLKYDKVPGMQPVTSSPSSRGFWPTLYPSTPLGVLALLHRYKVPLLGAHVLVLGRSRGVGQPLILMLQNEGAVVSSCDVNAKEETVKVLMKSADVVITATGNPEFIRGDSIKEGAVVIDIGISYVSLPSSSSSSPSAPTSTSTDPSALPPPPTYDFEAKLKEMDAKMVQSAIPARRYDCVDGTAGETARGVKMVGDVDAYSVRQRASLLTPVPGGVGPLTVAMMMRNVVIAAEGAVLRLRAREEVAARTHALRTAQARAEEAAKEAAASSSSAPPTGGAQGAGAGSGASKPATGKSAPSAKARNTK